MRTRPCLLAILGDTALRDELLPGVTSAERTRVSNPTSVLLVELVMSVDRLIESAKATVNPGSAWPPEVVLGHVFDVDERVWMTRLEAMVDAHRRHLVPPQYTWWEPVGDKTAATYASWSLDDAAARVMSQRIALLTQLRDLSPDDWNARAIHDTFGDMDVRELVLQVLAHDEEHRASFVVSDSG